MRKSFLLALLFILLILLSPFLGAEETDSPDFGVFYSGVLSNLQRFSLEILRLDQIYGGTLYIDRMRYEMRADGDSWVFVDPRKNPAFRTAVLPESGSSEFRIRLEPVSDGDALTGNGRLFAEYQILGSSLSYHVTSRMVFPVFVSPKEEYEFLNRVLFDQFYDDFYTCLDHCAQNFHDRNIDSQQGESELTHSFTRTSIVFFDPELICLEQIRTYQEGGAHLLTEYSTQIWGKEDVWFVPYTFDTFFASPGAEKELTELLLKELKEDGASWVINGEVSRFDSLENFTITEDGFVFIFNPSEVGSLEEGVYRIFLSFDTVRHFIPAGVLPVR